jgi:hypothetical protein
MGDDENENVPEQSGAKAVEEEETTTTLTCATNDDNS